MSYVDFAALKERVSIVDAAEKLGITLTKTGDQLRGPCPTCNSGGKRALVVTPSKQAFYCFGAHSGGDVIALVSHINGTGMKEAALYLSGEDEQSAEAEASKPPPEERVKGKEGTSRPLKPLTYLEPDHDLVRALGLEPETCAAFGAGYAPKGIMRGRLAIPIHDWHTGDLIAYCGQTVRAESPSLIFPNGFDVAAHVFNGHQIEEGECMLMRDPLEVMLASQNGIDNGICVLTETISAAQLLILASLMDEKAISTIEFP
jgi:hypothetical protein